MEIKPGPIPSSSTPSPDKGGNGLPKSFSDLEAKRGKPRGSKPGVARGPYNKTERPAGIRTTGEPAAELPGTQFTPENCKYLVELPFNLAFVRTGYQGFLLSESESSTLGASAATVLNVWVHVDPKWAALIMFSLSLASISAAKIMAYKVALAQLDAQKAAANGSNNGSTPAEGAK